MIRVRINNNTKQVNESFNKHLNDTKIELNRLLRIFILKIEGKVVVNLNTGTRSGRVYKRGKKSHQASSESEFPKSDTGQLSQSMYSQMVNQLKGRIGSNKVYALIHEQSGRSFVQPVVEDNHDEFVNDINQILVNNFNKK